MVGFFARMVKAEIKNISYTRKSLCNSVHNDIEHRIVPTTIRIVKFFQNVIEDYLPICYNACVVQPTPGNGRGCLHGVILHISCDCHSRCGLPPHQQMARQARQGQQIAWWMLCHYKKKRRIPRLYAITVGGFVLCLHGILHISLPNSIIAYANFNCKIRFL